MIADPAGHPVSAAFVSHVKHFEHEIPVPKYPALHKHELIAALTEGQPESTALMSHVIQFVHG